MAHKAPGKAFRQGLSIKALFKMFPDDERRNGGSRKSGGRMGFGA